METKQCAYLAFRGFEKELAEELKLHQQIVVACYERLFIVEGKAQKIIWAQSIWLEVISLDAISIQSAAKELKKHCLRWVHYSPTLHRRATLIQELLPKYKNEPLDFLEEISEKKMGAWSLVEKDKIIASALTSDVLPMGEVQFRENKSIPPSRAYLKLWELFTVHKILPKPGEICLDLGASPGGWSWVLQNMGCTVFSVDKAVLAANIASLPNIYFMQKSAFSMSPKDITQKLDWVFSDIICYPEKLLQLVERWLPHCENFVCTIKFQGKTDFSILEKFAQIPNSQIIHLFQNKHEVTWIRTIS